MTEEKIEKLVRDFEATTIPEADWKHVDHLIMATWYLYEMPEKKALEVIRNGIQKFNSAKGVETTVDQGYHDAITIFLTKGIAAYMRTLPPTLELPEIVDKVIAKFTDFEAITRAYYSSETYNSWPARKGWVEPDLKPFATFLEWCTEA